MKKVLLIMSGLAFASYAFGADIYVSSTPTEDGDGSKMKPYNSLSVAIEAAQSGDVIYLTTGKYLPDLLDNPRKSTFKIVEKQLSIIGGYDASFSIVEGKSLLSADVNGDDVYDAESGMLLSNFEDNCTRVMTVATNANVVLKNLILQGGYADMTDSKLDTGGGMYIGATVTMENCEVTGNYCKNSAGGGGLCVKGNLTMDRCRLYGNQGSGDGGAMYIKGDIYVSITNCHFDHNKSTSGSGVFFNNAFGCYFAANTFTDNHSETYGTFTVYNKNYANSPITLVNNTFSGNAISGNTTGKTLIGGSGVYVYTGAKSGVNLINNTIIGNSVEGYQASGDPSDQMGGAVFARQGTLFLANNVIAGNYSLGGYGDLYKLDAGVINSKEYNFFTSYDNMIVTPERNDIVAGLDRASGMAKLVDVFDCSHSDGKVNSNCVNNGGYTMTVKAHGENVDFDGLTIKSLPAQNLSESYLDVDLDNNGEKNGTLLYDQRGAKRDLTGNAFIGAYENDGKTTDVAEALSTTKIVYVKNGQLVLPQECSFEYTIYTISGQIVMSGISDGDAIDLGNLEHGCYVIKVNGAAFQQNLKVVL